MGRTIASGICTKSVVRIKRTLTGTGPARGGSGAGSALPWSSPAGVALHDRRTKVELLPVLSYRSRRRGASFAYQASCVTMPAAIFTCQAAKVPAGTVTSSSPTTVISSRAVVADFGITSVYAVAQPRANGSPRCTWSEASLSTGSAGRATDFSVPSFPFAVVRTAIVASPYSASTVVPSRSLFAARGARRASRSTLPRSCLLPVTISYDSRHPSPCFVHVHDAVPFGASPRPSTS